MKRVHARLRELGLAGCTVLDCFGAGQQVVGVTFAGPDWRQSPPTPPSMLAVFGAMRRLEKIL